MILVNFGDDICYGDSSPKIIANTHKFNYIDKSSHQPTSNLAIFKNIVRSSIEISNKENYIFLIGWTRSTHISYKNTVFIKDNYNHKDPLYNKLNKFNSYLFEPVLISQQRVALAHAAQEVLQSNNIKYYMYNVADKIDYNNYTSKGLKNLNNKFYHNALSFDSTMLGYIKKQGLDFENGKVAWANFISQKMRAAGVIEK